MSDRSIEYKLAQLNAEMEKYHKDDAKHRVMQNEDSFDMVDENINGRAQPSPVTMKLWLSKEMQNQNVNGAENSLRNRQLERIREHYNQGREYRVRS